LQTERVEALQAPLFKGFFLNLILLKHPVDDVLRRGAVDDGLGMVGEACCRIQECCRVEAFGEAPVHER